nr:DUF3800 domain-containing protein [Candidatus Sigynarchaeota archaeon]
MGVRHVFIDESGDFGFSKKSSRHIVIACLISENPFTFDSIIRKMRRHKFKHELASSDEIKANRSSPEIRSYMIDKLNQIPNVELEFLVINKEEYKVRSHEKTFTAKTVFQRAYKQVKEILRGYHPRTILIDNLSPIKGFFKDLQDIFKKDDEDYIDINIQMANSNSWSGLQFADLLAWCCFRSVENDDSSFLDKITLKRNVTTM